MYPACNKYLSHNPKGKPALTTTHDSRKSTDMSSTTQDAASLQYTCNTCLVAFQRSDVQRDHMRKDWQ